MSLFQVLRRLAKSSQGGTSKFLRTNLSLENSVLLNSASHFKYCRMSYSETNGNAPPGFKVLQEGEGMILQHGNDVFYNKAQVVNRDMSIAVLRTFIEVRKKEHIEEYEKKRNKRLQKLQATGVSSVSLEGKIENGIDKFTQNDKTHHLSADTNATLSTENEENPQEITGDAQGPETSELLQSTALADLKPLRVLEGLAATGLRAIRYAKEIDGVGSVVALDKDRVAVEACKRNVKYNGGDLEKKIEVQEADARVYMLTHEKEFEAVDLDPYGSPSIFLDSAVQSVTDGGLLLCTATDMAVLCGNNGEVCYSKYGGYPVRGKYCHEMALRILLASIESHANRYKRHIVPVLSLSVDFYIRVFVRVYTSANAIKASPSKLAYVFQCVGCDSFHLQPLGKVSQHKGGNLRYLPANGPTVAKNCDDCGKSYQLGGPIWAAPIHDPQWISETITNVKRDKKLYPAFDKIHSILTAVSEEILDIPLFVSLHALSATLKCTPPSAVIFKSAVINAGYRISTSHTNPLALKTDAPMEVLWDIMRCWVKGHPVKPQPPDTSGFAILAKEPKLEANFSRASSALSKAQISKVPRFLPNPEENWGPKPRAGRQVGHKSSGTNSEKGNNDDVNPETKKPKL